MNGSMFGLGDIVVVKNATVRMTVEGIKYLGGSYFIACVWFDGEDHLHRTTFNEGILDRVIA